MGATHYPEVEIKPSGYGKWRAASAFAHLKGIQGSVLSLPERGWALRIFWEWDKTLRLWEVESGNVPAHLRRTYDYVTQSA